MKDPAAAETARDGRWRIADIESAIVDPDWVTPALRALIKAVPSLNTDEDGRSSQQTNQDAEITQQLSVTNSKEGSLSAAAAMATHGKGTANPRLAGGKVEEFRKSF